MYIFKVVNASVIVVFAQVLNTPEFVQKYLSIVGFSPDLSPGRIVFNITIIVVVIYLVKNLDFSIQKMNYQFKNKLLHRYAEDKYQGLRTKNFIDRVCKVFERHSIFAHK